MIIWLLETFGPDNLGLILGGILWLFFIWVASKDTNGGLGNQR